MLVAFLFFFLLLNRCSPELYCSYRNTDAKSCPLKLKKCRCLSRLYTYHLIDISYVGSRQNGFVTILVAESQNVSKQIAYNNFSYAFFLPVILTT